MEKYIIEYDTYEDILALLGHGVPHTNLANVTTVIVDLTTEEYEALVGAGINIIENQPCGLLYAPSNIPSTSTPPPINTYLNVTNAHLAGFDGTGVNIALLDSGCNDVHAATVPTLVRQDYTGLGADGDAFIHGSRGCLIVGQKLNFFTPFAQVDTGIVHGCQLYCMRVIEGGGASVISAISWCIANNIHIINMSIFLLQDVTTAVNAAIAAGIIVICASGNSTGTNMTHPANIPGVIAVNGVQFNNAGVAFGSYVTDDAHTQVTVTNYNGGSFQTFVGGTSQACFMVTGLVAIYKQKYPTLNTQKAIHLLRRKALPMDGYTYSVSSTSKNVLLNYETGAGFLAPLY